MIICLIIANAIQLKALKVDSENINLVPVFEFIDLILSLLVLLVAYCVLFYVKKHQIMRNVKH